ncbi:hypothetical protein BT63DRAFT_452904 [Microthyrium microscopicum]|uniref:Uncharacterized protein n=1 Tax=Microthyrium microscopicum TaxID=703497 RepID=A0A6A6UMU9_9PEZI|nr:hypothetical protein BT63DRAFT_452904 [Microthyrium microscopicum]
MAPASAASDMVQPTYSGQWPDGAIAAVAMLTSFLFVFASALIYFLLVIRRSVDCRDIMKQDAIVFWHHLHVDVEYQRARRDKLRIAEEQKGLRPLRLSVLVDSPRSGDSMDRDLARCFQYDAEGSSRPSSVAAPPAIYRGTLGSRI